MQADPDVPSSAQTPADSTFKDLLAELLERLQIEGPAALDGFCSRHPGTAERMRARIRELEALGMLPLCPTPAPERIDRYRIVERLGRGGMGVVYLAFDDALGREVALKTLPARVLTHENLRERFRREIRTIASLQHPSIVPVYDSGEFQGVPYYTMEYVRGGTLAEILDELRHAGVRVEELEVSHVAERAVERAQGHGESGRAASSSSAEPAARGRWGRTYVETICRIVIDVAEALAHAHERGVQHRDVKPSNILVTSDGQAHLFDFGLARGRDELRVTRTGEFVGTPYYVSPEQASGDAEAVDGRADVYSLGVTLFELLTLRVPFEGETPAAVLRAIASREAPPARRLNPAVPRDLETICSTAMAKEIGARYASAADLAADLRSFLAYRPIRARPLRAPARLLRWVRRNPAWACVAGLGILLLVSLPLGLLASNLRIQAEAEKKARIAAVIQRVFLGAGLGRLGPRARAADLLLHALGIVPSELAELPHEQALVLIDIGGVLVGLEEHEQARASLDRALALLLEESAGEETRETAQARLFLADLEHGLGHFQGTQEQYASVVGTLARSSRPDDPLLLQAKYSLARFCAEIDATDRAEQLAREVLAQDTRGRDGVGIEVRALLASLCTRRKALVEAQALIDELLEMIAARSDIEPLQAALVYRSAARLATVSGEHERAVLQMERALELRRSIYSESSAVVGEALEDLGETLHAAGQDARALAVLEEARGILAGALAANPNHGLCGTNHSYRSRVLEALGRYDEAESVAREALLAYAGQVEYADRYGVMLHTLGRLVLTQGRYEEAEQIFLERESLFADRPTLEIPGYGLSLAHRGQARWMLGDRPAALELFREAMAWELEASSGEWRTRALEIARFASRQGAIQLVEPALAPALEREPTLLRSL